MALVELFKKEHRNRKGVAYHARRKDRRIMADLMATYGGDKLAEIIGTFFERGGADEWVAGKGGFTITSLELKATRIAAGEFAVSNEETKDRKRAASDAAGEKRRQKSVLKAREEWKATDKGKVIEACRAHFKRRLVLREHSQLNRIAGHWPVETILRAITLTKGKRKARGFAAVVDLLERHAKNPALPLDWIGAEGPASMTERTEEQTA